MPSPTPSSPSPAGAGQRELVVIAAPAAGLRATPEGVASVADADTTGLSQVLAEHGAAMAPLFGVSEERMAAAAADLPGSESGGADGLPDLATFYRVDAPDDALDALAEQLVADDLVEAAYVKPPAALPAAVIDADSPAREAMLDKLNDMVAEAVDAPPATPDFTTRQSYLDPAPAGIDARYAWTVPGGTGAGVRVIDCEWGWRFTHEDLTQNQGGVVAGTSTTDVGAVNHGTAVIGEISGDRNTLGITGIAPDAVISASSFNDQSSSAAIVAAANRLGRGDIILLEIHRAGQLAPPAPGPARVHRHRVVARRLRRHPLRGEQGDRGRRGRRQRLAEPRRRHLLPAPRGLPGQLDQPVRHRQPLVGRGAGRRGRPAARHPRA